MQIFRSLLVVTAVSFLGASAAHADTFNFSFGTAGVDAFNGSGQLSGNLIAPGEYRITAVTGTTDTGNGTDRPISGIDDTNSFLLNDNLLFFSNGVGSFDGYGLAYSLRNGAQISLQGSDIEFLERTGGALVPEFVPIAISATPEPGSFVLLGTGLLGAAGILRRRLSA